LFLIGSFIRVRKRVTVLARCAGRPRRKLQVSIAEDLGPDDPDAIVEISLEETEYVIGEEVVLKVFSLATSNKIVVCYVGQSLFFTCRRNVSRRMAWLLPLSPSATAPTPMYASIPTTLSFFLVRLTLTVSLIATAQKEKSGQ
jgi:hypothetical protein